jgi:basic membrane protein A
MPMRKRVTTLFIAAVALLGTAFAQDLVVTVTFDGGGWFDRSFNEGTWSGLTRAVQELSGETAVDVLIYNGTADTTVTALRRIAGTRLDLVVAAGFLQADAINAVSGEFPDVRFVLIDEVATYRPNVRSVLFKDQEGSYLVGYLAGTMSQTATVGFVGGMDVPLIRNFAQGYELGVRAACPECRVIVDMVGEDFTAWDDPATARKLAAAHQQQGADIIFAAAGASGMGDIDYVNETRCYRPVGGLRTTPLTEAVANIAKDPAYVAACAAGTQPLFFIGVDSNQNYLGDTDGDPATMNHGLTSMLKRVDVAAYNAVHDTVRGTFTAGLMELGVAEDGVGYALDDYNRALIPETIRNVLDTVRETIISGQVVVPDYRTQNP